MSELTELDVPRHAITHCCGRTTWDPPTCACGGPECREQAVCEPTGPQNVPACHHTAVCEVCKAVMLRSHAYNAGDYYLCYGHGEDYEAQLGDPREVPRGC
jgi:hypothetical protein